MSNPQILQQIVEADAKRAEMYFSHCTTETRVPRNKGAIRYNTHMVFFYRTFLHCNLVCVRVCRRKHARQDLLIICASRFHFCPQTEARYCHTMSTFEKLWLCNSMCDRAYVHCSPWLDGRIFSSVVVPKGIDVTSKETNSDLPIASQLELLLNVARERSNKNPSTICTMVVDEA